MHSTANGARLTQMCFLVAALAAQPSAHSQERVAGGQTSGKPARIVRESSSQSSSSLLNSRLLNSSEGMSVIGAALESRVRGRSRLDCSHLVHSVYTRAGFPYSYESSSELYRGVEEFRQVTRPQPGDLVVWPGHVGIVVNPVQNTFFSALRTGIGVDSYSSSYWKERGAPRFYRYTKSAADKSATVKSWSNTSDAPSLARTALEIPAHTQSAPALDAEPANVKRPNLLTINSAKPRPEEVAEALVQALNTDPEGLPDADLFNLATPLVVFSRLEVRGVKIHGDQGKAQVRITSPVSVANGQTNLKKRQESQNWPLRRRDQKTWELSLPQDAIYVSQDSAVRLLAHRLALSADAGNSPANLRQKSELAQMLNTILSR